MQISTKRAYEKPGKQDGMRVLVDRIWPRGIGKDEAHIDRWLKDVAPTTELRKWFNHEPQKWKEFKNKYFQELEGKSEALEELLEMVHGGRITLVYGAKDQQHNNAIALKEYLENRTWAGSRRQMTDDGRQPAAGSKRSEVGAHKSDD
jgi:uncharacterized protein YeaO (DUF488 family)